MNKVAALDKTTRADLFNETAARMNLSPVIVEKDFWVCWTLRHVFSIPRICGKVLFKGGTSLSKVFGLIQRFSEDIDLAVDYEMLGFTGDRDPRQDSLSHTKRRGLLDDMMDACRKWVAGRLIPALAERFGAVLTGADPWTVEVDRQNQDIVLFQYPPSTGATLEYIRPAVMLELGTHAEWIPRGDYLVKPYAADEFPNLFDDAGCPVTAITAERTFWEKATILHMEYYRPANKRMPPRCSRHYYDLAMMARASVRASAVADLDLLERVRVHKDLFYHCGWARYDLARPGTLRLVPPEPRRQALRQDYQSMQVMFFAEAPMLGQLLHTLAELETEINAS